MSDTGTAGSTFASPRPISLLSVPDEPNRKPIPRSTTGHERRVLVRSRCRQHWPRNHSTKVSKGGIGGALIRANHAKERPGLPWQALLRPPSSVALREEATVSTTDAPASASRPKREPSGL